LKSGPRQQFCVDENKVKFAEDNRIKSNREKVPVPFVFGVVVVAVRFNDCV
jgi:hypothetical protein